MEIDDLVYTRAYNKTKDGKMMFGFNEGYVISFNDKKVAVNVNKTFFLEKDLSFGTENFDETTVKILDFKDVYQDKIPGDFERLFNDLEEKKKNYIGIIFENPSIRKKP